MKLERREDCFGSEYQCSLTRMLDDASGIKNDHHYKFFHHYVFADEWCRNNKCLAIRVPGGTVGGIWIDDEGRIMKVFVNTGYVVKTYPPDINEQVQNFVGEIIEYPEN